MSTHNSFMEKQEHKLCTYHEIRTVSVFLGAMFVLNETRLIFMDCPCKFHIGS